MGLLSAVRGWLYQLLVRSHIIYYCFPVLLKIIVPMVLDINKNLNHKLVDKKGKKIPVCRVDGKNFPAFGVNTIRNVPNLTIRQSDILLCGYPKTGCHWTHEILHMLVTREAKLSKYGKGPVGMLEAVPEVVLDSVPSPRVLNTHFRFEELPRQTKTKKTKIVFTVRNPKDTVVSFYNHMKNLTHMYLDYDGDFDDFFSLFMAGELEYGSFFDYMLSWDKHIKNPTTNEILMVTFEEMKESPVPTVKKLAKFINVDITDQFAQEVVDAADIKKVRKARENQGKNSDKIYRKGKVGDWRSWLTDEQSAEIDRVWHQRMKAITYQPKYDDDK